ncbi:hypothetical protein [Roseomonas populi]|uniref:hypothetical protein n=1 Tax=Roseomonas populi TaxID=3121582 RepID=UPI0038CDC885
MRGTARDDIARGRAGDDRIAGRAGNDGLSGNDGDDLIVSYGDGDQLRIDADAPNALSQADFHFA